MYLVMFLYDSAGERRRESGGATTVCIHGTTYRTEKVISLPYIHSFCLSLSQTQTIYSWVISSTPYPFLMCHQ